MMNQKQVDELLYELELYAEVTLEEWRTKNPNWIPSWVEKVNKLSQHLKDGGILPSQWNEARHE